MAIDILMSEARRQLLRPTLGFLEEAFNEDNAALKKYK